ncbi:hypothetical protein PG984_005239 [Apiospora sp. TS-2023a]
MSAGPSTETAMQKALRLPEIVGMIAEALHDDDLVRASVTPSLGSFVLVNPLWFDCAVHLLWRHISDWYGRNLLDIFEKVDPSRRSFYAAFVQDATIVTELHHETIRRKLLSEVEFPMLRELRVETTDDFWLHNRIPALGKNAVREVDIVDRGTSQGKAFKTPRMITQCLLTMARTGWVIHEQTTWYEEDHTA